MFHVLERVVKRLHVVKVEVTWKEIVSICILGPRDSSILSRTVALWGKYYMRTPQVLWGTHCRGKTVAMIGNIAISKTQQNQD